MSLSVHGPNPEPGRPGTPSKKENVGELDNKSVKDVTAESREIADDEIAKIKREFEEIKSGFAIQEPSEHTKTFEKIQVVHTKIKEFITNLSNSKAWYVFRKTEKELEASALSNDIKNEMITVQKAIIKDNYLKSIGEITNVDTLRHVLDQRLSYKTMFEGIDPSLDANLELQEQDNQLLAKMASLLAQDFIDEKNKPVIKNYSDYKNLSQILLDKWKGLPKITDAISLHVDELLKNNDVQLFNESLKNFEEGFDDLKKIRDEKMLSDGGNVQEKQRLLQSRMDELKKEADDIVEKYFNHIKAAKDFETLGQVMNVRHTVRGGMKRLVPKGNVDKLFSEKGEQVVFITKIAQLMTVSYDQVKTFSEFVRCMNTLNNQIQKLPIISDDVSKGIQSIFEDISTISFKNKYQSFYEEMNLEELIVFKELLLHANQGALSAKNVSFDKRDVEEKITATQLKINRLTPKYEKREDVIAALKRIADSRMQLGLLVETLIPNRTKEKIFSGLDFGLQVIIIKFLESEFSQDKKSIKTFNDYKRRLDEIESLWVKSIPPVLKNVLEGIQRTYQHLSIQLFKDVYKDFDLQKGSLDELKELREKVLQAQQGKFKDSGVVFEGDSLAGELVKIEEEFKKRVAELSKKVDQSIDQEDLKKILEERRGLRTCFPEKQLADVFETLDEKIQKKIKERMEHDFLNERGISSLNNIFDYEKSVLNKTVEWENVVLVAYPEYFQQINIDCESLGMILFEKVYKELDIEKASPYELVNFHERLLQLRGRDNRQKGSLYVLVLESKISAVEKKLKQHEKTVQLMRVKYEESFPKSMEFNGLMDVMKVRRALAQELERVVPGSSSDREFADLDSRLLDEITKLMKEEFENPPTIRDMKRYEDFIEFENVHRMRWLEVLPVLSKAFSQGIERVYKDLSLKVFNLTYKNYDLERASLDELIAFHDVLVLIRDRKIEECKEVFDEEAVREKISAVEKKIDAKIASEGPSEDNFHHVLEAFFKENGTILYLPESKKFEVSSFSEFSNALKDIQKSDPWFRMSSLGDEAYKDTELRKVHDKRGKYRASLEKVSDSVKKYVDAIVKSKLPNSAKLYEVTRLKKYIEKPEVLYSFFRKDKPMEDLKAQMNDLKNHIDTRIEYVEAERKKEIWSALSSEERKKRVKGKPFLPEAYSV